MKRFEKCKRILAFLLVALMVVQQSSVTTLAEELSADTQNIQTQEEASETTEENKAENVTSDADNSEGQSESTPAPSETEPTAAPEVSEPTATPTQAATAEVTAVPEQETETTVSEVPAETKTEFSGTVDNATASVSLSDAISAKAVFVAKQYGAESEYFTNNAEAAVAQWAENNNLTVLDTTAYDMHFEENDQEISVSQHANVKLTFNTPILTQTSTGVISNIYVLHVVNGQAVTAGTATQNADGAVTAANISTDGFSPFVFVKAVSGDAVETTDTNIDSSANLNEFIKGFELEGATKDASGKYNIAADQSYNLKLHFEEERGHQFDDGGELRYTLPDGLTLSNDFAGKTHYFDIGNLKNNTFTYDSEHNQIVVHLNTEDVENFNAYKASATAEFSLEMDVRFSENITEVDFSDNIKLEILIYNSGLEVSKSASLNNDNGSIDYVVTVKSTGNNNNVVIRDTLTGSLVQMYTASDITEIKSNKKGNLKDTITPAFDRNQMMFNISSMVKDEIITIKYSAKVDYTQIEDNTDVTEDETMNTVTARSDEVTNEVSISEGYEGQVYYPSIKKGSQRSDNKVTYTITANENYRYDISGKEITDTITGNPQCMKFSGKGITVRKYDQSGTQVGADETISWADLNIDPETLKTWTYQLPTDAGKYKYVITYTAEILDNHDWKNVTVVNRAEYADDKKNGYDNKDISVAPVGGTIQVNKTGEIVRNETDSGTTKQIKWKVTFDVITGHSYAGCKIEDTLPNTTINNEVCSDSLVENSVEVEGLIKDDEGFEVKPYVDKGINKFRVKFYYTQDGQRVYGLRDTGSNRTIKVTYLTDPNQKWLDNSTAGNLNTHKNTAVIYANTTDYFTRAGSVDLYKREINIQKTATIQETDKEGLSVIKYEVTVTGIDSDSITIQDLFDKNQLIYYTDNKLKPTIGFDNKSDFKTNRGGTLTYNETGNGAEFIISNIPKNSYNDYYPNCKLTYYLKVKDQSALESIATSTEGGKVTNTAVIGDKKATNEIEAAASASPIKKTMLPGTEANGYVATYTLTINENKRKYGSEDYLNVEDTMENAWLTDTKSIDIQTEPAENKDKVKFTMDVATHTLNFKVPNETKVVITYNAAWTGKGNLNHKNTAKVYGYTALKEMNIDASAKGSGSADTYEIKIHKSDKDDGFKSLKGAVFKLQELVGDKWTDVTKRDKSVVTVTTDEAGEALVRGHQNEQGWVLYPNQKYRLVETKAPDGYVKMPEDEAPVFTITKDGSSDGKTYYSSGSTIFVTNQKTSVNVSKKAVNGEDELKGAHIQIVYKDEKDQDKIFAEWDSDEKKAHTVTGLVAGKTYILRETKAPDGYTLAADTTFVLKEDGTIDTAKSTSTVENGNLVIRDALTSVNVSKKAATGEDELKGAHIQIVYKDEKDQDKIFAEWDSDETEHTVTGLVAGKTYILRETKAPNGYTLAADTTFVLKEDGTIDPDKSKTTANVENGNLVIRDALTSVNISKKAATGEDELSGAHLQIVYKDQDDKETVFAEWNSDGTTHTVTGLVAGKTYILRETKAPEGYTLASDTTFVLKADGTIDAAKTTANVENGNLVIRDTLTSVNVSKKAATGEDELAGAHLQIVYKDQDDKETVFAEWNSDGTTHTVTGLVAGKTYILRETKAPEGYTLASDTTFVLKADGTIDAAKTTANVEEGNLVIRDTLTSVNVSKKAATGEDELSGAHLQIVYKDQDDKETVFAEWNSDGTTHTVTGLVAGKMYILRETKAPEGYTLAADTIFVLKVDGTIDAAKTTANVENGNLVIRDTLTSVNVSKKAATGEDELAGAHLQIVYKDEKDQDKIFAEWDSDGTTHTVTGLVAGKTYILRETKAPEGYTLAADTTFVLKVDGTIDAAKTTANVENGNLVIRDTLTSVNVSKKAATGEDELAGAHLQIVYKDEKDQDKIFAEWDSDGTTHTVTGLVAGKTYILRETKAPDGYTLAADTTFVLKEDGTIDPDKTTANVENGNLVIRDTLTSVNVSKKAATGEDELAGAHLQIVYKDEKDQDKIFAEWDSDGTAHTVTGLVAGKTYILRETKAPDGYTLAADTTFVLKEDGTIDPDKTTANVENGNLVIRDTLTSVSIKKTDIVDGKELAGATLQILDKDKKVVTIKGEKLEWTSTTEAKEIKGLVAGETYYLHEVTAPTGYEVAKDTKFVLKTDGTVDTANTTTTVKDGVLLVQDSMIKSEKASIEVTKTLVYEGTELGAADQTFYVALYGDEACTNRLSDVKALTFKNTSSATAKFTDLEIGRKYYVSECSADGTAETSGVLADAGQTAFIANFLNGNTVTVDKADETKEIAFQNEFLKIPDGFYKVGKLTITKKLLGADGKAKNSSDTFYAGIFDDAAHTKLSESVSQNVVALALNGASSITTTVDVSVVEGTTATLYVTEVDADGKPVANADSFMYDVNIDNETVSFTDTNIKASVTITNQEQSEEEDEETIEQETEITSTPAPTKSVTPTKSQTSSTTSVKTGDNTPIALFVLLLAAAVAVIAFIFIRRNKDKK